MDRTVSIGLLATLFLGCHSGTKQTTLYVYDSEGQCVTSTVADVDLQYWWAYVKTDNEAATTYGDCRMGPQIFEYTPVGGCVVSLFVNCPSLVDDPNVIACSDSTLECCRTDARTAADNEVDCAP